MTYEEKKKVADAYLIRTAGIGWDDLSDINSLHDCETKQDIVDACKERLGEDGFPEGLFD